MAYADRSVMQIVPTQKPIVVDGVLEEWEGVVPTVLKNKNAWAVVRVTSDGRCVYIGCEYAPSASRVHVFMDMRDPSLRGSDRYTRGAFNIEFASLPPDYDEDRIALIAKMNTFVADSDVHDLDRRVIWKEQSVSLVEPDGIKAASATHRGTRTMEIAIPWQTVARDGPPAEGERIGFNLMRNRPRETVEYMQWSRTYTHALRPELFGRLRF